MQKLFFISAIALFFASCEKLGFEKEEKPCPTVSADGVPGAVVSAFSTKHPGSPVKTWFNTDNKGYAALFDHTGKEALDYFDNSGNFQKEEIDGDNQDGNHDEEDGDDKGCECETED